MKKHQVYYISGDKYVLITALVDARSATIDRRDCGPRLVPALASVVQFLFQIAGVETVDQTWQRCSTMFGSIGWFRPITNRQHWRELVNPILGYNLQLKCHIIMILKSVM